MMELCLRSLPHFSANVILLVFFLPTLIFTSTEAYDPLDPNGNITIKWDVMTWTPDGYVAVVTMFNFQKFRHIQEPGWKLGWTWAKKEVIWSIFGAQTSEQGNCSKYKENGPHSCQKNPRVVDLLPGTPYNQQVANCCKGGLLSSLLQDPSNSASSFQLSVGEAGNDERTVKVPKNFTLEAPGPGYTCGPVRIVKPTIFITADGRRMTRAMMTWNVTCTYSQFLAQKTPACCVSLSSFYDKTIVPCPSCACGCQNNSTLSGSCVKYSPRLDSVSCPTRNNTAPQVQYETAMLWGVKGLNDNLLQAGRLGNVQSDILFQKDSLTFTLDKGWAFPRRIYFNGDSCVMPPPDAYPYLPHTSLVNASSPNISPSTSPRNTISPTTSSPNTSSGQQILVLTLMITLVSSLAFCFA
ncbi:protein COBRA-like isoform X2 [Apium graveolens]|uniref:protein COBRA-like isoform X2 n=1 Tax=Apium graveolens TaxID=4045 RepID=UPI003D796F97